MDESSPDKDKALRSTRMIWAALLLGQVTFIVVVIGLIASGGMVITASLPIPAIVLSGAVAMVSISAAQILRMQMFKRHWEGDLVTPRGYVGGTIAYLAVLEGASMVGLVLTLVDGRLFPMLLPVFALLALQVINFPTGKPMA